MNIKYLKFLMKNKRQIFRQYVLWSKYSLSKKNKAKKKSPLTTVQRNFFYAYVKNKNAKYNMLCTHYDYYGTLDIAIFEQALNTVTSSDSIFRSIFKVAGDSAYQVPIEEEHHHTIDVIEYPDGIDDVELAQLSHKIVSQPFNLEKLPLLKITIIKIGKDKYRIINRFHHIIIDGFSFYLFQSKLAQFYKILSAGDSIKTTSIQYQYKDFAAIESQEQSKISTDQLLFWKEYFKKIQTLEIPHLRSLKRESKVVHHIHNMIPRHHYDALLAIKKKHGVTLNVLLMSIFFLLIHKHASNTGITVLIPRFARFHSNNQKILGPMLNVLPIHCDLDKEMTFVDILVQVKETINLLIKHDHHPFDTLIHEINANSDFNLGSDHFELLFNFISKEWRASNTPDGLKLAREDFLAVESNNLLTVYVVGEKDKGCVDIQMTYQHERLPDNMARMMIEQYAQLIEQICTNEKKPLKEYQLQSKVLQPCETTISHQKTQKELTVVDLLSMSVKQFSDRVAITHHGATHTYQELFNLSVAIAQAIKTHHNTTETPIIVFGERNIRFYASLIACLIVGRPFCMIDIHSDDKVIIKRCTALDSSLALHSSSDKRSEQVSSIITTANNTIIDIQTITPGHRSVDTVTAMRELSSTTVDTPAYVIFTSGSTGEPKKITGTHKGLVHFIQWQINHFRLNKQDRCAQITNCHFDVVLREIFTPLCSGANLIVPNDYRIIATADFFIWLDEQDISYFHTVPSIMRSILKNDYKLNAVMIPSLRYIFFAGEPLAPSLINRLRAIFYDPGTIVNLYGPSEMTLAKCFYIAPDKPSSNKSLSIGLPIAGCSIQILNSSGQQCNIGEAGEIHLFSEYATQGYENKWYATGDLGFHLPDGNVYILGRTDDMVKINGVRVKLLDISMALNELSYIQDAHISLTEENEQKILVAHIALRKNTDKQNVFNTLIQDLKKKLPNYMIPSKFNILKKLPRLSSGKIDKVTLNSVKPSDMSLLLGNEYRGPQTDIEKTIHDIWCEVLNKEKLSILAPFYSVGGSSLNALKVSILMNQSNLSNENIMFDENQTIQKLAKLSHKGNNSLLQIDKRPITELTKHVIINNTSEPKKLTSNTELKKIFLTGSTGFVGSHLLQTLLKNNPKVTVYCLVRGSSNESALQYLLQSAKKNNVHLGKTLDRIKVINGNLSEPKLGMSKNDYKILSNEIDSIIHCGALVNFLYQFEKLAAPNIQGTSAIIDFSKNLKTKPIHYISTVGIFPASERSHNHKIMENDSIYFDPDTQIYGGYAQTKWVAEAMILEAKNNGHPINIYRLGRISGHSESGFWPEHDFIFAFLSSCIKLKMLPDLPISIDMLPVDICAQLVNQICMNNDNKNKTYHVVNHKTILISELAAMLNKNGIEVTLAPYEQWHQHFLDSVSQGLSIPLAPFISLFPEHASEMPRLIYDRQFDNTNLMRDSQLSDSQVPELSSVLLMKYIQG